METAECLDDFETRMSLIHDPSYLKNKESRVYDGKIVVTRMC